MLRYRSLWAGSILSVIVGMALYGAPFAVPIFAQTLMHYTSQETGMPFLPSALASAVTMIGSGKSSAAGRLPPGFGYRRIDFGVCGLPPEQHDLRNRGG